MNVIDNNKAIIVVLKDEKYEKLIIEVENPTDAITLLTGNARKQPCDHFFCALALKNVT